MSILEALQAESVLNAALGLVEAGVSVVPVRGKMASVSWAKYQTQRATFSTVHEWHKRGLLEGVAVVCGNVSGISVIDLDGHLAVETFEKTFPHLLNTLTVLSGSGQGKHLYYRNTDTPAMTTRTKGYELRANGCYVVAPPSKHPISLACYKVINAVEPQPVDLTAVQKWIMARIKASQSPRPQPRTFSPNPHSNTTIKNPVAYAAGALMRECQNVRLAASGARNNALFKAAMSCGNLVSAGWIQQHTVEDALMSAAASLAAEDGNAAVWNTIQSGLAVGFRRGMRA